MVDGYPGGLSEQAIHQEKGARPNINKCQLRLKLKTTVEEDANGAGA